MAAISGDLARNVELYDAAIQGASAALRLPGLREANPELRRAALFAGLGRARATASLFVADERGGITFDSEEDAAERPASVADRDYFQMHRDWPDAGLYISRPFLSRLTGTQNLAFSLAVNGEIKQKSNTNQMLMGIAQQISWGSTFYTLWPGDIIMTGTCEGVSRVKAGDTMHCVIEGVGEMDVAIR